MIGRGRVRQVYDVARNVAKPELDGGPRVWVHRKGATRAFRPERAAELPADDARTGQPVFVPGSMGTGSWVLCGQDGAEEASFGSACHGAGRRLSRHAARRLVKRGRAAPPARGRGHRDEVRVLPGVAEEAPFAYEDVDRVVEVIERAGVAQRVGHLVPLWVLKG